MDTLRVLLLVLFLAVSVTARNPLGSALTRVRRTLNLSSLFGSATTSATPYDRIACHPVFQVTTSWGAPYMNFEQVEELPEEKAKKNRAAPGGDMTDPDAMGTRPVALFFMDPDDAIQQHEQMKQMGHMKNTDMRITTTTLAKALRQASNLGNGLPTGVPPDPDSGNLKTAEEGGSLRYKIVPPKRQLFYAARCLGRERLGLFGKTPAADAEMIAGNSEDFHATNKDRRREKKDPSHVSKYTNPMQQANAHMEGYTGIPVFYVPEMTKVLPKVKQITTGVRQEIPLFFSYEDMMDAWNNMRERSKNKGSDIPVKPKTVEVFNLWDVLTSMDKDRWYKNKQQQMNWKDPAAAIKRRFAKKSKQPGLESITFVPPSHAVKYKERTSAKGNGKARLRPMR